jgi:hypothetical protein
MFSEDPSLAALCTHAMLRIQRSAEMRAQTNIVSLDRILFWNKLSDLGIR